MKFRHPKEEEKHNIERLWDYCFEKKDDPFFKFYFDECYDPKTTLVGTELIDNEEETLAMVHLRPYNISLREKAMEMAYIVGVATDPTARRSGVGREILVASLKELREKGHALNILMPSMAGFYQQYGWDLYCHQWLRKLPLEELRRISDRTLSFKLIDFTNEDKVENAIADLMEVYKAYTTELTGYALRAEKDWRRLLKSISLEGLNVVITYDGENPVGYMFYKLGEPEIMVPEFVYATRKGQKALLGYIYNHRSQGSSIRWNEGFNDQGFTFYPNGQAGNEVLPFMMSRVVDVKKAFTEVPIAITEEFVFDIKVVDPIAEWNNGVFEIQCVNGKVTVAEKAEITNENNITIEVGSLGLMFFGKLNMMEIAFEEKANGDRKTIEFLTKAYPKCQTYINEWY